MSSNRLLRRALLATALATSAAALVAPAVARAAASGCAADCVTVLSVAPRVESAVLTVTTTVPASVTLKVWQPGSNPFLTLTSPMGQIHTFDTGKVLAQGSNFGYSLTAKDAGGAQWTESAGFATFKRTVTVKLNSIKVTDDGDLSGAGEIRAGMRVTKSQNPPVNELVSLFGFTDISSGATRQVGVSGTWTKPASGAQLQVELYEDDHDPLETCAAGFLYYSWTTGSDSCADWTTAAATLVLREIPGQSVNTVVLSGSGPVDFIANATVTVAVSA